MLKGGSSHAFVDCEPAEESPSVTRAPDERRTNPQILPSHVVCETNPQILPSHIVCETNLPSHIDTCEEVLIKVGLVACKQNNKLASNEYISIEFPSE